MKKLLLIAMMAVVAGCSPKSSERNMIEAHRLAKAGEWQDVLDLTTQRVKDVPGDMNAKVLKALAIMNTNGDNSDLREEAVDLMRQATSTEPERYDYQLVYGWILLDYGRTSDALLPLKTAYDLHIKEVSKDAVIGQDVQGTIKYALAVCYRKNKMYPEAIKFYEQALKSTPYSNWPSIYSDIAICYVLQKNYAKAMEWCNKARNLAAKVNSETAEKYPHTDLITLNLAIIHDYLSWPANNKANSAAFVNASITWYRQAKKEFSQKYKETDDVAEKTDIQRKMLLIDKRILEQTARLKPKQ